MAGLTVVHVLEAVAHGTGRHVLDLIRHSSGVDHHLVVPERPTSRGETEASTARRAAEVGAHVHAVPMRRSPLHPDLLRAVVGLRRLLRRLGPDVAHAHATVAGAVTRIAAAGACPVVYTPNGLHPSRTVGLAERALRPLTDHLVAVSPSEATRVVRTGLAARGQVTVIPNGIDPQERVPAPLDLREELDLPPDVRVVGFVGRLSRQKAPEVLLAASARLGGPRAGVPFHLVLVGGGPEREAVAAEVDRLGATGWVHLPGHVPGAAGLLDQFDVLALPSRWEGCPYVPLEAFRAGTPVVVTDVVGSRDLVEDGRTGLLVPPDDDVALAGALRRLLADPDLAADLVAAAARRLASHFDVRDMAAATVRLYGEMAGRGSDLR